MKITLLGLEFALENLGCEALAYSFANEMEQIAQEANIDCDYTAVVFADSDNIIVPISQKKVNCFKIQYKKLTFWRGLWKLFQDSDLIFDFTGGDSFSDLYGKKRFYMATLIKYMAIQSRAKFILGPQTYGPYKRKLVKRIAALIIKRSDIVYARDSISQKYASDLSKREIKLSSDVAFELPYEETRYPKDENFINIGFNPSGLLWNGGYSFAKLPLVVNYKEYCERVLFELLKNPKNKIHLITHVGTRQETGGENDYGVCKFLHEKFPQTVLANIFESPMDAKAYISTMDVFIGARMHATIAAFSSGVATIPFSYSRKFEGIYYGVNYNHLVHACEESTSEAVRATLEYVDDYKQLQKNANESMKMIEELNGKFKKELVDIVDECAK